MLPPGSDATKSIDAIILRVLKSSNIYRRSMPAILGHGFKGPAISVRKIEYFSIAVNKRRIVEFFDFWENLLFFFLLFLIKFS